MLGRNMDKAYVAEHINSLKTFRDVDSSFWAYDHILEATNGHDYDKRDRVEIWESHAE